jgi:hypothetical protein
MLPLIADYSTSRYVYPNTPNPAQYILRSTIFTDIYTSTIKHAASSFNMTGPLNIESSNRDFNLNILGSARIIPYQGQTLTPSIDLNNIDIYTQDSIIIPNTNHTISVRNSTITFNEGELTINRIYNSPLYGRIGINTLMPNYSLDIAQGNARKPTGTAWINPSDSRIKQYITDVDNTAIYNKVSSLRLVSYSFIKEYCESHKIPIENTIGFLSQEVEKIFPKSVTEQEEAGYSNFKSLDIDQLYKAKFKVTQILLQKFSTLQSRLLNLTKESS